MNEFVASLLGALTATAAGLAVAYWCARWFRLEQQRSLETFRQDMRTLVEKAAGGLALPEEVQEQAGEFVKQTLQRVSEQLGEMGEKLADFNKQRNHVREEISRGARRTESRPA